MILAEAVLSLLFIDPVPPVVSGNWGGELEKSQTAKGDHVSAIITTRPAY